MKKILITGSTGGLGRNLVPFYLQQGFEVTALGRNLSVGKELEKLGARFYPGEMDDEKYVEKHVAHQDYIIHAAALTSPWGKWENFYRSNVLGTEAICKFASEASIKRFVHISTPSIYYTGLPQENIKEDDPLPKPHTHYARSKIMAEEIVLKAVKEKNLQAVMLRPRALFGPYDTAIIPRLLRVMEKGVFPLPNKGSAKTNVTYVDNVVHAVNLALNAPEHVIGQAYNITNGEALTIKQLAELLRDKLQLQVKFRNVPFSLLKGAAQTLEFVADHVTNKEPVLTQYSVGLLGVTQTLDISKAQKELGYSPLVSINEGLDRFIEWRKTHES